MRDTRELKDYGINSVAIMSNDPAEYPEDSFDNMKRIAEQENFPFPYLWDETQAGGFRPLWRNRPTGASVSLLLDPPALQ